MANPARKKPEDNLASSNAFLREVDEAMHLDQMKALWQRLRWPLIGLLVALFIGMGVWEYNKTEFSSTLETQAETYWQATDSTQPAEQTQAMLQHLAQEGTDGFRLLAGVQLAQRLAAEGQHEQAAAAYESVASDAGLPALYRDLAKFYQGQQLVVVNRDRAQTIFAALESQDSPFRASALEMMAMLAEDKGDFATAMGLYERILELTDAPQGVLRRARIRLAEIERTVAKS